MTSMIFAIVLGVLLLLALITIAYLLFSTNRKRFLENIRKEAKKERGKIIGLGYKEIKEAQNQLKKEKDETMLFISKELNRLDDEKKIINELRKNIANKENKLDEHNIELNKKEEKLKELNEDLISKLENVSNLTREEAKKELMEAIKYKSSKEITSYLKSQELEAHRDAKEKASNIIIEAMEKFKTDIVNERVTTTVELPNEQMKGRIIGKDGRNIKTFEQYGGVDIIIDDTPDMVMVSSFNPIRREIAVRTLKKLMNDGRIQPVKIENELKVQEEMLEDIILETGQKTIEELKIFDMDIELVKLIGRLKYRTSYTQNVLMHSVEVAKISRVIANELGLDAKEATRAGLLHDIGKAIDFEEEGNHVELGVEAAKKYGESEIVINAIAAHHEGTPKTNLISEIVSIADSISAARPGARNENIEDFAKRILEIEDIINEIPGVVKAYAIQAGRQVRVMVDPAYFDDYELVELSQEIKERLKNKVVVPGDITLTIIRETRETQVIK